MKRAIAKARVRPIPNLAKEPATWVEWLTRRAAARTAEARRFQRSDNRREVAKRVERVRAIGRNLFTTDNAVFEWLDSPAVAFGGRRPIELLDTDEGEARVKDLILGIEHGVPQ